MGQRNTCFSKKNVVFFGFGSRTFFEKIKQVVDVVIHVGVMKCSTEVCDVLSGSQLTIEKPGFGDLKEPQGCSVGL